MTQEQEELIEQIARRIVRAGLATPAAFFFEMHRPFNALFYNGALFLQPIAAPLFGADRTQHLVALLRTPGSIEKLLEAIDRYSFAKTDKTAKMSKDSRTGIS